MNDFFNFMKKIVLTLSALQKKAFQVKLVSNKIISFLFTFNKINFFKFKNKFYCWDFYKYKDNCLHLKLFYYKQFF